MATPIVKSECILVYVQEVQDTDGNTIKEEHKQTVKCDLLSAFSAYYYGNFNRDMMKSKNLRIAKYLCEDYKNGQLRYVIVGDLRYKIEKILTDKERGRRFVVLDCEELK